MPKVGVKVLGMMVAVAAGSAFLAAAITVMVMAAVQDSGTMLVGSDRWFLAYTIPVIVLTLFITVLMYTRLAKEKITFSH